MKLLGNTTVLLICIILQESIVKAQTKSNTRSRKWVPENGYWVIESNIHFPKANTFYFYNNEDSLIYTERVEGKKINIKNKTTLKKLKDLLDSSLLSWDKQNVTKKDGSMVETVLK